MEVGPSLEELLLHFRPDVLAMVRAEGRNEDFSQRGVDPRQAFKPIPNVVKSESIIFDDSDVRSCMVEAMALSRDHHAMFVTNKTIVDFFERLCYSLALVS